MAAEILSAPQPAVSATLKTRKELIAKIREVCAHRGIDPKPMNLGRRRKNSLQEIIQTQFSEAAETAVGDDEIPEGFEGAPKNMAYAVQMLYRMDRISGVHLCFIELWPLDFENETASEH